MRMLPLLLLVSLTLTACDLVSLEQVAPSPGPSATVAAPTAPPQSPPTAIPTATPAPSLAPSPSPAAQAKPTAAATASPAAPTSEPLQTAVRRVADARKPAVVLISNLAVAPRARLSALPQEQGIGSGVIIDPSGLIVTNNHVVEGATALRVVLPDGRTFDGQLVGRDPRTDLAVIRITGDNLPVAPLAPSLNVGVGDWVIAIGNALGLPGGPTVTAGVVSALDRTVQEPNGAELQQMIQTDAAINPGNSGGPLLNLQGEVVGINTAGIEGASGLGFAISVATVHEVVPQLIQQGRVVRPFIGITSLTNTPGVAARYNLPRQDGILVTGVLSNTPAARAGLTEGDIIIALDGTPSPSQTELRAVLANKKPGDTLTLTVQRGTAQRDIAITLIEAPAP